VLGVGTGGVVHGIEAWEVVGVPYAERDRRTHEALALLPRLIRGETVELPSGASITLSPGADVPPILIGGNSPAALRRAIRHGAGWFSSMTTPPRIADGGVGAGIEAMRSGSPSRTAAYMALFRAIESSKPADERLFEDPLALAFLDRRLRVVGLAARLPILGRLVPWYIDHRWPGPRLSGVVRTRAIDDAVREALVGGCSQLVLLGAGYDTRGYRLHEAAHVETFEVDHPVTQAAKRAALERELGTSSCRVHLVSVDFERDSLAKALDDAGLRPAIQTCVVWEGVFSYLTLDAIDATLRWAVEACAPGGRLILTYVDVAALRPADRRAPWITAVDRAGEPFVTGLDPSAAADFFAERGFDLLADASTRGLAERLAPSGASTIPSFYRVAVLGLPGESS
jgi:methyltransferase (TIGR00027 family)